MHYLADKMRGPVWEEVIIHLPAHVSIIALSATVSNAEEFGAWIREVRSSCEIIVSEQRPVPLYQHMIVGGGHLRPIRADRQAQAQPRAGGRYERLEDARRARISLVESTRARAPGVAAFHTHLAGSRPPAARDHLHFLARGLRGRRAPKCCSRVSR